MSEVTAELAIERDEQWQQRVAELVEENNALRTKAAEWEQVARDRLRAYESAGERLDGVEARIAEHEQWREQLEQDLLAAADRHDLCSFFDEFMADHGMLRRERDYRVPATVTYTTYVQVQARSFDEAVEAADNFTGLREQVREALQYDSFDEVHLGDAELA